MRVRVVYSLLCCSCSLKFIRVYWLRCILGVCGWGGGVRVVVVVVVLLYWCLEASIVYHSIEFDHFLIHNLSFGQQGLHICMCLYRYITYIYLKSVSVRPVRPYQHCFYFRKTFLKNRKHFTKLFHRQLQSLYGYPLFIPKGMNAAWPGSLPKISLPTIQFRGNQLRITGKIQSRRRSKRARRLDQLGAWKFPQVANRRGAWRGPVIGLSGSTKAEGKMGE